MKRKYHNLFIPKDVIHLIALFSSAEQFLIQKTIPYMIDNIVQDNITNGKKIKSVFLGCYNTKFVVA